MTPSDEIQKISLELQKLQRRRAELMGFNDLDSDLALQTNCDLIGTYYKGGNFKELANTAAMIQRLCREKSFAQRSYDQALAEHAAMAPGVKIPQYWNAPADSYFRFRAPIVVSAKSGVGKSTLARNIAVNNIMNRIPTVYATNEDTMSEALIGMFTIYTMLNLGQSYSFQEVEKWLHETKKGNPMYKDNAMMVYRFAKSVEKYLSIIEVDEWNMSSILLGIEREENKFGEPPKMAILDYMQQVDPEGGFKEMRHQMIYKSRLWKNYNKTKDIASIMISQLNDDGRTAESTQFEKDAGQWFTIERDRDEATEELSSTVTIRIKKGRRTGTGKMICAIDGKSGAFIPSVNWRPKKNDLYGEES